MVTTSKRSLADPPGERSGAMPAARSPPPAAPPPPVVAVLLR